MWSLTWNVPFCLSWCIFHWLWNSLHYNAGCQCFIAMLNGNSSLFNHILTSLKRLPIFSIMCRLYNYYVCTCLSNWSFLKGLRPLHYYFLTCRINISGLNETGCKLTWVWALVFFRFDLIWALDFATLSM